MRNWSAIRERYLRDALPVRLGGLAANLARIRSFSYHAANAGIVESLLDESKYFVEWTAAEAEVDTAAELVALQIQLAVWQRRWSDIWANPENRAALAEEARRWAERVLELSGLRAS
jgi:hypothetical protein